MNSTSAWSWRLPVVLSVAALTVAAFGSTSVGQAFSSGITAHAKRADFARNAGAVNGIKASKTPKPGKLIPLGPDGKFPTSVGLAGPKGEKGDKGDTGAQGPAGLSGYGYYLERRDIGAGITVAWAVLCPTGQKALGGGASSTDPLKAKITESAPIIDEPNGWGVGVYNGGTTAISAYAWVICANVAA
jgi:hypothetical protein